jgi:hypothetical protein
MKRIILSLAIIISSVICFAQAPQFAVVRPDGTTYICPSWDSAYNKAVNGDNIYMPGITINSEIKINKKLFIYGAGHHPDSSIITGKTIVTNNILKVLT